MRKLTVFLLAAAFLLSMACCGASDSTSVYPEGSVSPASSESATEDVPEPSAVSVPAEDFKEVSSPMPDAESAGETPEPEYPVIEYPIADGGELTLCTKYMENDCSDLASNTESSAVFRAAEEATGVHISVIDISAFSYDDQLTLMLASGNMPDLIRGFVGIYSNGIDDAIEEGYIVDISDYFDLCPDYARTISLEVYRRDVATDSGAIGAFYGLDESDVSVSFGFYIRDDYLDKVGMNKPVTIAETTNVLTAFKNELGLQYPIYLGANNLSAALTGAWDVPCLSGLNLISIDGNVTGAPFADGFDDAISTLASWYSNGLISSDFVEINGEFIFMPDTYVTAVTSGATGLFLGGTTSLDTLESMGVSGEPEWSASPMATPVLEEGQVIHAGENPLSRLSGDHMSINADCENVDLAIQWCNYFYTEEGSLLASYGIEGESYEFVNNEPVLLEYAYTSDGQYTKGQKNMNWLSFPFGLYMKDRSAASYSQHYFDAVDVWNSNLDHAYYLPNTYSLTVEESAKVTALQQDITTVMDEGILKFITGETPLSELDDFRDTLKSMGWDEMISIVQNAYDRYLERE